MGVFRPLIGGIRSAEENAAIDHSNDKPFTPADVLTVSRPVLAATAGYMLLHGKRPASVVAAAAAATDMEGVLARAIEKRWPGSGWGITEHGAEWDTYADATALLIIGACALKGPRVSLMGKAAIFEIIGQEGSKAGWAMYQNARYQQAEEGRLYLPPSLQGKEAMAEKLVGAVFAVATNDFDDLRMRTGLGVAALGFATTGAIRGELARRSYQPMIDEMMEAAAAQPQLILPEGFES